MLHDAVLAVSCFYKGLYLEQQSAVINLIDTLFHLRHKGVIEIAKWRNRGTKRLFFVQLTLRQLLRSTPSHLSYRATKLMHGPPKLILAEGYYMNLSEEYLSIYGSPVFCFRVFFECSSRTPTKLILAEGYYINLSGDTFQSMGVL